MSDESIIGGLADDGLSVLGSKFNAAQPAANSDIFASALNIPARGFVRVNAQMTNAGLLKVRLTRSSTTVTLVLNNGNNLTASTLNMFDVAVEANDTVNIWYSATGGTVDYLEVQFYRGAK